MIEAFLFGNRSLDEMKAGLDAGSLRQRVIASNIANANTPGYAPQQVRSEELLDSASGDLSKPVRTHADHMTGPEGNAQSVLPRVESRGLESVELEQEMVELQQNTVHYRALSEFVAKKYRGLMDAIGTQG